MASNETALHAQLKRLAIFWAQEQGFRAVAAEVRLPRSGFISDVAAYKPATRRVALGRNGSVDEVSGRLTTIAAVGATAVFECKQARSDFLKDSYAGETTMRRLTELESRRAKL